MLDPTENLTEEQRAVLAGLREQGGAAPVSYLRGLGLKPGALTRVLEQMEAVGVVERVSNAHGRETPWWWQPLPPRPPDFAVPEKEQIAVGAFYDRKGDDKVWFEVLAVPDENEMVRVSLCAGPHRRTALIPAWTMVGPRTRWWLRARSRTITEWSAQFECPVHGECSEEMVRTDKTCALCRTGLIRL